MTMGFLQREERAANRIEVSPGCASSAAAPAIIASAGLGSCVAVTLYDPDLRIGGMAHVMLPDSVMIIPAGSPVKSPYRFADKAVEALLRDLEVHGAGRRGLLAKLAGGARMFGSGEADSSGIGRRNVERLKDVLQVHHIPLVGWDIEGSCGRCVELHLDSGDLVVIATGHERMII
jgi:chemotaxis protein CheD